MKKTIKAVTPFVLAFAGVGTLVAAAGVGPTDLGRTLLGAAAVLLLGSVVSNLFL